MTAEPNVVHQAERDENTGRVVFVLEHGLHRLVGQVASEEEYRNYLASFQAWNKVKLPSPSDVENLEGLAKLGADRA